MKMKSLGCKMVQTYGATWYGAFMLSTPTCLYAAKDWKPEGMRGRKINYEF